METLRIATAHAAEVVGDTHPFSTRKFRTDGETIFAELSGTRGSKKILDIVKKQYAFSGFIAPYLYEGLEWRKGQPTRWFPLKNSRRVVIDPSISFGQPTINPEGVPTTILARAYEVEKNLDRVAHWYEVPKKSVQDAVTYQQSLAA